MTPDELKKLVIGGTSLYEMGTAASQVFEKLPDKIQSSVESANALRISFQQSFGIFEAEKGATLVKTVLEFNNKIRDLEISSKKLAANFQELGKHLNSFIYDASEENLLSMAKTVSLNEKFAISTGDSISALNTFTTNFGMATKEAQRFNNQLIEFARETNQSPNVVFNKFSSAIKEFYTVLDPTKAASQFTAFEKLARGFGGEISDFMSVAKQFDTLEGAAQFGAGLNNVLSVVGGSFDAMQASMMNYDDRIKYVIKSVADSRQQIMQMDEISRQAYIRQLTESTKLKGEQIQAILNNEKLADSVEGLMETQTFAQIKAPSEQDLAKFAPDFTPLKERSELFMDQFLRLGNRLERFADSQTKRIRDTQVKMIGAANDVIFASKNVEDLLKNIKKTFSSSSISEMIKDAKKGFDDYMKRVEKDTKTSLEFLFKKQEPVLPRTPGIAAAPGSEGPATIGTLESGVTVTESISKGIKDGITESSKLIQAKEMKITVEATPQLMNLLLKINASQVGPGTVILGAKANPAEKH